MKNSWVKTGKLILNGGDKNKDWLQRRENFLEVSEGLRNDGTDKTLIFQELKIF